MFSGVPEKEEPNERIQKQEPKCCFVYDVGTADEENLQSHCCLPIVVIECLDSLRRLFV